MLLNVCYIYLECVCSIYGVEFNRVIQRDSHPVLYLTDAL